MTYLLPRPPKGATTGAGYTDALRWLCTCAVSLGGGIAPDRDKGATGTKARRGLLTRRMKWCSLNIC